MEQKKKETPAIKYANQVKRMDNNRSYRKSKGGITSEEYNKHLTEKKNITGEQIAKIVNMKIRNISTIAIARELNVSFQTVKSIYKSVLNKSDKLSHLFLFNLRTSFKDLPKSINKALEKVLENIASAEPSDYLRQAKALELLVPYFTLMPYFNEIKKDDESKKEEDGVSNMIKNMVSVTRQIQTTHKIELKTNVPKDK